MLKGYSISEACGVIVVLNYSDILIQENVIIGVLAGCIPLVCVACILVVILTPLFIGMCKVNIVTSCIECVQHAGLPVFSLYGQCMCFQNRVRLSVCLNYQLYSFHAVLVVFIYCFFFSSLF